MVKFLIVRFSSIGDIILTTPVARHLKKQVEDAEVHYLTKTPFVPILEANPYVDKIHSFDGDLKSSVQALKAEGIDYIIDLHHNARSALLKVGLKRMDFSVRKMNLQKWLFVNFKVNRMPELHMVDRNLKTVHNFVTDLDDQGLDYFIPERDRIDISSLPAAFQKGYIGLAIGAQHETKKLPVQSIIELCKQLSHPVLILGGPSDKLTGKQIADAISGKPFLNTCGLYNLNQSASLVEQSNVLITHDTGLMHMGAAFRKKVISIWGNTVPAFGMSPYRADDASVQFQVDGLKCRPCSKIGYQHCPKKHFKCMMEQDLAGIASTANQLFSSTVQ
jgi:ADP-heptose:LPS heptosyltransferase